MRRHLCTLATLALAAAACADEADHDHDAEETALFEQAYADTTDGKADETGCNGVRVPDQSNFNKTVALTFDDGPNPATTPQVIEVLRRQGVPATFFINSKNTASAAGAALARQIAADPTFILANHSHSHSNFAELGPAEVATQIDRGTRAIEAAGGSARYFRFPYGSSTCSTARAVRERGYAITGWHIDSADWCYARHDGECRRSTFQHVPDTMRSSMRAYVMSQVQARRGGILLFHDIHAYTASQIEAIVVELKAQGYRFTNLDDTSVFPRLNGATPAPTAWIGDPCTTDAQCNFEGGFCHERGTGGVCTTTCTSSCPDRAGEPLTRCVTVDDDNQPGAQVRLCAATCGPDAACGAGLACEPHGLSRNPAESAAVCWTP